MPREKKSETLAMKVQSSLLHRLNEIAEAEDRPIGYVARELLMRGLNLYEVDGHLRDTPALTASRPPAPVVARIEPASGSSIEDVDDREVIRRQLEADILTSRKEKRA